MHAGSRDSDSNTPCVPYSPTFEEMQSRKSEGVQGLHKAWVFEESSVYDLMPGSRFLTMAVIFCRIGIIGPCHAGCLKPETPWNYYHAL